MPHYRLPAVRSAPSEYSSSDDVDDDTEDDAYDEYAYTRDDLADLLYDIIARQASPVEIGVRIRGTNEFHWSNIHQPSYVRPDYPSDTSHIRVVRGNHAYGMVARADQGSAYFRDDGYASTRVPGGNLLPPRAYQLFMRLHWMAEDAP